MSGLVVRWAHFAGFSLWIAGIVAMALLIHAASRNKAAGVLADVGATITIVSGLYNAIRGSLFSQPWLHIKLTLVVALIVIHVLLRIRMKRGVASGATGLLAGAIVLAVCIMYLVIFRPLTAP